MNAEVVRLSDVVLDNVDLWRRRATMFAFVNPIGFYVTMGCTLPEYLAKLREMENTWKRVVEKAA